MARTAFADNSVSGSTTTPQVDIVSSGSAAAGDLLVCFFGHDGTGTITNLNGWTSLKSEGFTGAFATIVYKVAAGGETQWLPTMSVAERWAAITYRWPAGEWHGTTAPEVATRATGSSTQPNPPTLTPSWGTDSGVVTSYVAACFADDSSSPFPITGWPTDFTLLQTESGGDAQTSAADVAAAMYEASVASKDPAVFTMTSTETWAAYTVAVRGPAGGGGTTHQATAALSANATLAAAVRSTLGVTAGLNATATVAPTARVTYGVAAALNASAAVAATAGIRYSIAATLNASASLAVVGEIVKSIAASLTATASLSATPKLTVGAAAALSASATLDASAGRTFSIAAALSANAQLAAAGVRILSGAAALEAVAELSATAEFAAEQIAGDAVLVFTDTMVAVLSLDQANRAGIDFPKTYEATLVV